MLLTAFLFLIAWDGFLRSLAGINLLECYSQERRNIYWVIRLGLCYFDNSR